MSGNGAQPAGACPASVQITGGDQGRYRQHLLDAAANATMNQTMIAGAGGNQLHADMQPYLVVNFCIAPPGIFPSR